jgi:hypothetical protein
MLNRSGFVQNHSCESIFDITDYRDNGLVLVSSAIGRLVVLFKARAYGVLLIIDDRFFGLVHVFGFIVFAIAVRPLNTDVSLLQDVMCCKHDVGLSRYGAIVKIAGQ